jgi:predicted dehydrogenase
MSDLIRIGIIGAGGNTRRKHIPKLLELPDVEVVAVCNRTVASAQAVCDEFNIPRACATPDQVIGADDVDAIVIGTWPNMHAELTCAALEAGKHVMCEARMARNAEEAEQMLRASQAHPELVAQIVPAPFSLPYDEAIRRVVTERLGTLRSVRMQQFKAATDDPRPQRTWRLDRELSGNNIMGVGIWYESLMRWVGPVASVQAKLMTHLAEGIDPATGQPVPIEVPDHVEAIGEMACGGLFSMTAHSLAKTDNGDPVTLIGSEGVLIYAGDATRFSCGDDAWETIEPDPAKGWRVEAEFIGAIRGTEQIQLTDFQTGLRYMRFTDALHESHRLGQVVNVDA